MRCITIQNKEVLKRIAEEGEYKLEKIRTSNDWLIKPYELMKEVYGYKSYPIFLSPIGFKVEMMGADFDNQESIVLEFDIPEEYISVQKYYDWTDFVYFMNNQKEFCDNRYQNTTDFGKHMLTANSIKDMTKKDVYQVTVEVLKKDWLIHTSDNITLFDEKYNGSGGNNILDGLNAKSDEI